MPSLAETIMAAALAASAATGTAVETSATASGGSSASALSHVVTDGTTSVVEVRTVLDGVETVERRESTGGENVSVSVTATSSAGSSATASSSASSTPLSTEDRVVVERMLTLVRDILAYFGITIH